MVQRVGDHRVLAAEQGLEQSGVGVEAGRVEDCILETEKARDPCFQFLVRFLGSADESH